MRFASLIILLGCRTPDTPIKTNPVDTGAVTLEDLDGDGFFSDEDCDDNDETAFGKNGKNENCAASSCAEILADGFSTGDGNYFLNPSQLGVFPAYCEMDQQSGGWTLLLSADGNSTYCRLLSKVCE